MAVRPRYEPEAYWSRVGSEIHQRGENFVAGDDNPYLRYKRDKFLATFLDALDVRDRVVLELGSGPGGNLERIAQRHGPKRLLGADLSATMCALATRNLSRYRDIVEIHKTNGRDLPFADRSVDVSFTATVLQHVTDEPTFESLVGELCRVTRSEVVVMEDIGRSDCVGGPGSWVARKVGVYEAAFVRHGFVLSDARFLGTRVSRAWYVPVALAHKVFAPRHREGEPVGPIFRVALAGPMAVTRYLDRIVPDRRDLAKMVFRRVGTRAS